MCRHSFDVPGYAPGCILADALRTTKILGAFSPTDLETASLDKLIEARTLLEDVKAGKPTASADSISHLQNGYHYTACEVELKGTCSHQE